MYLNKGQGRLIAFGIRSMYYYYSFCYWVARIHRAQPIGPRPALRKLAASEGMMVGVANSGVVVRLDQDKVSGVVPGGELSESITETDHLI